MSTYQNDILSYFSKAEKYTLARGDEDWFSEVYLVYRESFGIRESSWRALAYLYSYDIADTVVGELP